MNQSFQFEHNKRYAPLVKIEPAHLQELLQTRLNFSFPKDILDMSPLQAVTWYSQDGVDTAIGNLNRILYGTQVVKKEEAKLLQKAEVAASKSKGKGKNKERQTGNSVEEMHAIDKYSPTPGSSGKNSRKASNSLQTEEPAKKRSKIDQLTFKKIQPSAKGKEPIIDIVPHPHNEANSDNEVDAPPDDTPRILDNGDVDMESSPSPPPTPPSE